MGKNAKAHCYNAKFHFHSRQQVQAFHNTAIFCNQNRKSNVHKHKHNKLSSLSYSRFKYMKALLLLTHFFYFSGSPNTNKHERKRVKLHLLHVQVQTLDLINLKMIPHVNSLINDTSHYSYSRNPNTPVISYITA